MAEAERLVAEGQDVVARHHLHRAVEFWRSVDATRFLREAEDLSTRIGSGRRPQGYDALITPARPSSMGRRV